MDIIRALAEEMAVKEWQVKAAVTLIDEGNTIPFIARYRKEATGTLSDEQLRTLNDRLTYMRNLEEKKEQVIGSIREQGVLTPELEEKIRKAQTQVAVEDLYRPFRPKRRTRATMAKERGLEMLAAWIADQPDEGDVLTKAAQYVDPDKEVPDPEAAVAGALDILAEALSDEADVRTRIREMTWRKGSLICAARDPQQRSVYEQYYDFSEPVSRIAGHRVLAVNRGEKEKVLTVKVEAPKEEILRWLEKRQIRRPQSDAARYIRTMVEDAYGRLLAPAIEREIRTRLTEQAQEGAIHVFGQNLQQLLMQPPLAGRVTLGWDPAFRTGCKLAVIDETGKVLDTAVIYPTAPTNPKKIAQAKQTLLSLIKKYKVSVLSVGNGTASRESELFIADFLKEEGLSIPYVIVNEAGASVYSASPLATEEFPQFDVGQRSAASIARRLQDPLAELVKIEPRAIGVGQYQHDMNQKQLASSLEGIVEDCVNKVGVDLNTASAPLLSYVAGISPAIARSIVSYREEKGRFTDRRQLLSVPKLGPKAFLQCAGFLRIRGGKEPLDSTAVHPESYEAAARLLHSLGCKREDLVSGRLSGIGRKVTDYAKTAGELGIGEPTLRDIVSELEKPGRDPREDMPKPILRSDVLEMTDLKEGMVLKGTVRNVIDFGAFVDIGVHQDGLVHISQITDRYIKHPLEVLQVGDVVDVKILSVDVDKKRISLTMRGI